MLTGQCHFRSPHDKGSGFIAQAKLSRYQGKSRMQHSEQKKTKDLKKVRKAIASGKSHLLKEEVRHVMECSAILGQDASSRVMNPRQGCGGSRGGCLIKEIGDQISLLQEESGKVRAKPMGYILPILTWMRMLSNW
jgi:hypothetical protein